MKRQLIYLTAALVLGAAFLAIADEAEEQELFRADHQLEQMARTVRSPALEPAMRALSTVGSGYVLIPLSVALGTLLWRRGTDLALALPVLGAGVGIIEVAGKWLVHRPRPRGHAFGFPSGHAIAATVFFAFLVYVVWTVRLHPALCWVVTVLAALLIVGVAASRVYLHAHWFSDVLGGVLAGAAYVCAVVWCIERRSGGYPYRS